MAIIHQATLVPSKLELLNAWVPTRPWYRGPEQPSLQRVTSFRFDDPAGEVGVETMIIRAGDGPLLQVPLTYRAGPLALADEWLVGTAEHSALGRRWVYDGCGDPVYAATLATAIFTGGGAAEEFTEVDGELVPREVTVAVRGSGAAAPPAIGDLVRVDEDTDPTLILTDAVELAVLRYLDVARTADDGRLTLTGAGAGMPGSRLLAMAQTI
jgi:hypothetical protein